MKVDMLPADLNYLLCERVSYIPTPSLQCLAAYTVNEDGTRQIHGIVGMDNWSSNSVQVHIAIENPFCARSLVKATCQYAYDNDRKILIGQVSSKNEKALKFDKGIGFKELFRIKDAISLGDDIVIMRMDLDSSCRWIEFKDAA